MKKLEDIPQQISSDGFSARVMAADELLRHTAQQIENSAQRKLPMASMETQNERLLKYLCRGNNKLTPLESWQILGIYRLSARIHDLRTGKVLGTYYPIKMEMVEVINRWGDTARVAQYSMDWDLFNERIEQAEKAGRRTA